MTPEDNKELIRRFMQAFNERDRDAMRPMVADDVNYGGLDAEGFLDIEFAWCELFPDLRMQIDGMIAEDDRVAFRWTFIGTHTQRPTPGGLLAPKTPTGEHADSIGAVLASLPPTGTRVDIPGMSEARIEDGRIAEWWGEWRSLSLYQQLGARLSLP